jgi:hypothetical protein
VTYPGEKRKDFFLRFLMVKNKEIFQGSENCRDFSK